MCTMYTVDNNQGTPSAGVIAFGETLYQHSMYLLNTIYVSTETGMALVSHQCLLNVDSVLLKECKKIIE